MSSLPSGVVTFLFTDIEGSTSLWERFPEQMELALRRHDTLVRDSIEHAGGTVFKTVGDAFCAAFASPLAALDAAVRTQRSTGEEPWPPDATLRIRIALHTGWCEPRDEDYFGTPVNLTARLEAAAHGGQIVCSQATAELLSRVPNREAELAYLGAHELAGISAPVGISQINVPGLQVEFPPLRAPVVVPITTNLPVERSTFLGRHDELGEVMELVRRHGIVTLAGSGGVGKTRLAIEAARELGDEFADGAWLVELASTKDPDSVPAMMLAQLGIPEQLGREGVDLLVDTLRDQHRLVVLDNCEHLLESCATLCDELSRRCAGLRILVTSRSPLRVEGEQLYRVPPLSLPPDDVEGLAELGDSGAVALFVERAVSQHPQFRVRDEDAAALASICRRLDGMPLALELATARLGSLSLSELDERLKQRFKVLSRGNTSSLPRQQTLRALIDWSYELMRADERALFARLSIFQHGFDLPAAEGTCALDDLDVDDVAELLDTLVEKSLVVANVTRPTVRYSLLESLREYAADRLRESEATGTGEASLARDLAAAHARHYLAFYAALADRLADNRSHEVVERGREEQYNLRAAAAELTLGEDATPATAALALRMLGATASYADSFVDYRAIRRLLDQGLEHAGTDAAGVRGAALYCKARVLMHREEEGLTDCFNDAMIVAHEEGDLATEVCAMAFLGARLGDATLSERAVAMARSLDEPSILAVALIRHGAACLTGEESELGVQILQESLMLSERLGDAELEALNRLVLSAWYLDVKDLESARSHLERVGQLFELAPPPLSMTCAHRMNLGFLLVHEGNPHAARAAFHDGLRRSRLSGTSRIVPDSFVGIARCAILEGRDDDAARLLGGAAQSLALIGRRLDFGEQRIFDEDVDALRGRLGERFDALYGALASKRIDELIHVGLEASAVHDTADE